MRLHAAGSRVLVLLVHCQAIGRRLAGQIVKQPDLATGVAETDFGVESKCLGNKDATFVVAADRCWIGNERFVGKQLHLHAVGNSEASDCYFRSPFESRNSADQV